MSLTKIICDNDITFHWREVLDSCFFAEQSIFNSDIYSIKGLADLAISNRNGPGLIIHPSNAQTIEKVCVLLSQAVSAYYNTKAEVAVCSDGDYSLQVKF